MEITPGIRDMLNETKETLSGYKCRHFMAQVVETMLDGSPMRAEKELGWNRVTLGKALAERGGEPQELLLAQRLGVGEMALEGLRGAGQRPEPGAFRRVGRGVERIDRGLDGLMQADFAGDERDASALPGADVVADLVFLHHGGEGGGGAVRGAQEGVDPGIARLAGELVERADRGEAAVAGDEAVAEAAFDFAEGEELDRAPEARRGDGEPELGQRLGVEGDAVAGQRLGVDLVDGNLVDILGQGPLRVKGSRAGE